MPADARAICHEAGHAVIGLYFGFNVSKIEITDGRPNVKCAIDSPERPVSERLIFLAGGAAAETLCFPGTHYEEKASGTDQAMIATRGGASLDDYIPDALLILASHQTALDSFREKLRVAWIKGEAEFTISRMLGSRARASFELLSETDIQELWEKTAT